MPCSPTTQDPPAPVLQSELSRFRGRAAAYGRFHGVYLVDTALDGLRSMTWRTAGTAGTTTCPYNDTGATCAVLMAAPNLSQNLPAGHPMLQIDANSFVMDHLIVEGNRDARASSADCTVSGGNYTNSNIFFRAPATSSVFTNNVTRNAVCGSGMVVDADSMTIRGNYFYQNGDHGNGLTGLFADGLTATHCSSCDISYNNMTDNTDVQLVIGNGTNTTIMGNTIQSFSKLLCGLALITSTMLTRVTSPASRYLETIFRAAVMARVVTSP